MAEALAKKGVPFRTAYKAVGALVRELPRTKEHAAARRDARAGAGDRPAVHAEVLRAADASRAGGAQEERGGTGPASVGGADLSSLTQLARAPRGRRRAVPRLETLFVS